MWAFAPDEVEGDVGTPLEQWESALYWFNRSAWLEWRRGVRGRADGLF